MSPLALLPVFLENPRVLEIIGLALGLIFWFQMLRYCITREPSSPAKFLWIVFMIVVPGIGSILYYLFRVANFRHLS